MRDAAGALDWMRRQAESGATGWKGYCLRACRTAWDLPGGTPDADAWWSACPPEHRHPWSSAPPAGAPIYWRIGIHGHVALSDGAGGVWGTDLPKVDRIGLAPIDAPRDRWGAIPVGWGSWLNGSALPLPGDVPPAPDPAPPALTTPEGDPMLISNSSGGKHRAWFVLLTNGMLLPITNDEAKTWTGPRLTIYETPRWNSLTAACPIVA